MKVFVPKLNTVAKTLLALAISLNAQAYDQGQGQGSGQGQGQNQKSTKAADQSKGIGASHFSPFPSSSSSSQGSFLGGSQAISKCDQTPKCADSTCQNSSSQRSMWGSRWNYQDCKNTAGGLLITPATQVKGWHLDSYQAKDGAKERRDWRASVWENVTIDHVDLYEVNAERVRFTDVSLYGDMIHTKFNWSVMNWVTLGGNFADVDFKNASLHNVLFKNAHFDSKHTRRNNFDGATLKNVRFEGGNLEKMTFEKAHLKNVTFDCAQIKHKGIFDGAFVYNHRRKQYLEVDSGLIKDIESILSGCNKETISSSDFFANANGNL